MSFHEMSQIIKEVVYSSEGILKYGPGIRAIVVADQGISDYYRKMIPKYYGVQPQFYPAHITVVRNDIEKPTNMDVWQKYEGEPIPFTYNPEIRTDGTYWYLDVLSDRVGDIREELGLPRFRLTELGASRGKFHLTIANSKNQK
jgi:hypothetical protein